jgi:hypothetical protein
MLAYKPAMHIFILKRALNVTQGAIEYRSRTELVTNKYSTCTSNTAWLSSSDKKHHYLGEDVSDRVVTTASYVG